MSIRRWTKRWLRRARALTQRSAVERELDEELAFHLEMETEKLLRAGLAPDEARRRARLAFGGVERHKEEVRDARWQSWVPHASLDFKLGFRMLRKYPGLTLVGGLAIAFAVALGAATFEFATQFVYPSLPLPGGDRIVALRNWDAAANAVAPRALHDVATWRRELRTVHDVGAYLHTERNVQVGDGGEAIPTAVAAMSAAGFRVTRVPPLLGRTLVDADERAGAPHVIIIGYDVWQRRFDGDPAVVGREVRLAGVPHTVVGVMPAGYAFPLAHQLWVPLRLDPLAWPHGEGPPLARAFGRLAPGASLGEARAELATLGQRAAADHPRTHRDLRAQVLPYAKSWIDISPLESVGILSSNLLLVLFMVLVCANVALLVFARAATREAEIAVRSALGASRGRIVAQLLAETLVLGGVAAIVGLLAAAAVLRWGMGAVESVEEPFPFWFSRSLSLHTVLYAVLLTVVGAVVAGVLPALRVTRGLHARLKLASAGGGGLRFGGVWTAVIVGQIAVTVAVPVHAYFVQWQAGQVAAADVGVSGQFLTARVELDRAVGTTADSSGAAHRARLAAAQLGLVRRLAAVPGVAGVTYGEALPGQHHPHRQVAVEPAAGGGADTLPPKAARVGAVAPDYFEVLGAPIVRGRGFTWSDTVGGRRVVVVNESFVSQVLGGQQPIGQRVRYVSSGPDGTEAAPEPWHEIVGVVRDVSMGWYDHPKWRAGLYHPVPPGALEPLRLAARVQGPPTALAPRLRELALGLDPSLRLYQVVPLGELSAPQLRWLGFLFWITLLVVGIAVLLSLAGIYAVMSFTVARRTREIGIRVALGASAARVVAAVFRRPLTQVGLGVLAGGTLAAFVANVEMTELGGSLSWRGGALFALYVTGMLGVCLLACVVPTRRALRVEPTEALRAEG